MCVGQVSAEGSTCVERDVWQGTGTLYLYGKSRRRSGEDHNSVASETLPLPARTEMTAYLRCFRALVCNMRSALLPPASLTLLCRWRPFPCSARPSSSPRRGHGSKQRTPDRHRWGQSTTPCCRASMALEDDGVLDPRPEAGAGPGGFRDRVGRRSAVVSSCFFLPCSPASDHPQLYSITRQVEARKGQGSSKSSWRLISGRPIDVPRMAWPPFVTTARGGYGRLRRASTFSIYAKERDPIMPCGQLRSEQDTIDLVEFDPNTRCQAKKLHEGKTAHSTPAHLPSMPSSCS